MILELLLAGMVFGADGTSGQGGAARSSPGNPPSALPAAGGAAMGAVGRQPEAPPPAPGGAPAPYSPDASGERELAREKGPYQAPEHSGPSSPQGSNFVDANNGGASTLGEYQQRIPQLIREQSATSHAAEKFQHTVQRLAAQHGAQARELNQVRNLTADSRDRLDTSSMQPLAAAPSGLSGFVPQGSPSSPSGTARAEPLARTKLSEWTPASLPIATPPASPRVRDADRGSEKNGNLSSISAAGSAAASGRSAMPSAKETEKKDLRKLLAARVAAEKKRAEGEKLSAQETSLLEEEKPALGPAGEVLREAEASNGVFTMAGSETDAAVKEFTSEAAWTQAAPEVLTRESEALFERVHAVHKRSLVKGLVSLVRK